MEVKWFFVLFGLGFTIAILTGMYFINENQSQLDRKYYQETQQRSDERFNNSTMVHRYLFDNVTDIKTKLDPILNEVDNASQMRYEQKLHYNQTSEDFEKIKQILDIKLEDHETLNYINQSLNKLWELQSNGNGSSTVTQPSPTQDSEIQKQNNELLVSINKTMMGFLNEIPIN